MIELLSFWLLVAPAQARDRKPAAAPAPAAAAVDQGATDAGPTGAGPTGAGPTGAGPTGAGPTGAGGADAATGGGASGGTGLPLPVEKLGSLPGLEGGPVTPRPAQRRTAPGGIFPVYETPEGWMLLDRRGKRGDIPVGTSFLVVGSKAAGVLTAARGTLVTAACVRKRPAKVPAYALAGRLKDSLGTPIIALRVPKGRALDTSKARFYPLVNEVADETYQALAEPLRQAVIADAAGGRFLLKQDDTAAAQAVRDADPKKVQLKLDFGSKVRIAGMENAFMVVESANISRSARRCVRLLEENALIGGCAEMPHDLMAETQILQFVAYDPSGRGKPFVLAYTTREPMWGHERWGFQLTPKGAKRFLMDAWDAKCREGF